VDEVPLRVKITAIAFGSEAKKQDLTTKGTKHRKRRIKVSRSKNAACFLDRELIFA
jgi:hypothetical protein